MGGAGRGWVIFRNYGEHCEAFYVYDVTADLLYFVADIRLTLPEKKVSAFETGGHPLVGNRLAMMIYFEDGTAGEYLGTLPKLPTKVTRKSPSTGLAR